MADAPDMADQASAAVDDISKGCFGVIILFLFISALTVFGLVSAVWSISR